MTADERRRKIKDLIKKNDLSFEFFYDHFTTKPNTYYRWKRGANGPQTDADLLAIEKKVDEMFAEKVVSKPPGNQMQAGQAGGVDLDRLVDRLYDRIKGSFTGHFEQVTVQIEMLRKDTTGINTRLGSMEDRMAQSEKRLTEVEKKISRVRPKPHVRDRAEETETPGKPRV